MAVRYARKALTSNDPSVIEKAKWARGIALCNLGLVGFGILAIPFLIFIDVNFALSANRWHRYNFKFYFYISK